MSRGIVKKLSRITTYRSRTLIYDLQTYHASQYGQKNESGIVKKLSRITTYGESNSYLRPPNYHDIHYGRKLSLGIVKISAALPLTWIRTLITTFKPTTIARNGYRGRFEGRKFFTVNSIYDLQSYHASHYGRKISRDNVKNFSRITTYGESNSNLRPPNYHDIHYGRKMSRGIVKKLSRITTYRSRTLIYDLQTYHASQYGQKNESGIVKKLSRITTYGESNSYLRPPNYHDIHYGGKLSLGIVKISAALPLTWIRTLITTFKPTTIARNGYRGRFEGRKFLTVNSIYDLQSYHASHYGRKISRDNVKNFSRITTYGESNSNLRPPNYHDIHYGRKMSRGIVKKLSRITTYRSQTLIYDLQTYHASQYGQKNESGHCQKTQPNYHLQESNSSLRPPNLQR